MNERVEIVVRLLAGMQQVTATGAFTAKWSESIQCAILENPIAFSKLFEVAERIIQIDLERPPVTMRATKKL